MLPYVVCFFARNGAGKSTQGPLVADIISARICVPARSIDTAVDVIEAEIYPKDRPEKTYELPNGDVTTRTHERKLYESGDAATSEWVSMLICELLANDVRLKIWPVFTGSPRKVPEARDFTATLESLADEGALEGCVVVRINVEKEVARERIESAHAQRSPEEQEKLAYKLMEFDKRWDWFVRDTGAAFDILESARGLFICRITVNDDGTRTPQAITQEIVWKLERVIRGGS